MSARLRLSVFVQNHVGRKGVPIARSFEQWVRAALAHHRSGATSLNIVLFDVKAARAMNRQFRDRDYATNVLSFPYEPLAGERATHLGDLALCPAVVAREARKQRRPLRDHYAHLTVHGVLHLLGHDHQNDREAQKMEALERGVLAGFGIADPYEVQ